jgi:ABC-type bacteriocin/lantibiotic exporter with double-glycine peptidase domain
MKSIISIFNLLDKKFKSNFYKLLTYVFLTSFLQFFFLTSIVIVISVLANTSLIYENKYFLLLYNLGFESEKQFLNAIIFFSLFLVILSSLSNLLNNYLISKFSNLSIINLENIFFNFYINSDYSFFKKNSQNRLISKLKDNINFFSIKLFPPIFVFSSAVSTLLAIIIVLLYVDYKVTVLIFISLASTYYFFFVFLKSKIKLLSQGNSKIYLIKTEFIINTFKNLKVLKFFSKQNFKNIHFQNSMKFGNNVIKLFVIESSPRIFMELVLYAGSLILIFYFYKLDNQYLDISKIVFFGLASSKALPSINQIFISIVQLKSSIPYIESFKEEIYLIKEQKKIDNNLVKDLTFEKTIELNDVSFFYQKESGFSIKKINLKIDKNNFIGICGRSGSGKTTIVDLLSGVYTPKKGQMLLDNNFINETNLSAYKNMVSYVPQEFFIGDSTVKESILFGSTDYNEGNLDFALEYSGVNEFINNLPNKLNCSISDRGINLSLGQKQRISIARALYKRPSILILDEATNSLDLVNEKNILNNLKKLKNEMTIIFISHKVTSLNVCDYIFLIKDGRINDKGKYDYLKKNSKYFQELIN